MPDPIVLTVEYPPAITLTAPEVAAPLTLTLAALGPQGAPGLSAYEVAVANGYVGTEAEWLTFIVGIADAEAPLTYDALNRIVGTGPLVTMLDDLQSAVDAEAASRSSDIAGEAAARAAGDAALAGDIDDEATARQAADTALAGDIVDEENARLAGDTALDGRLDTLEAAPASIPLSQKGAANGVATLGADSKLPTSQLPSLAIQEVFTVADQAAMLALSAARRGDVALRSDNSKAYILSSDNPSVLADWIEWLYPGGGVASFAGRVGLVLPASGDYAVADITGLSAALAAKASQAALDAVEAASVAADAALDVRVDALEATPVEVTQAELDAEAAARAAADTTLQSNLDAVEDASIAADAALDIRVDALEAAGPGIDWQGAWNSGSTYYQFDAVSYGGSSYVSKTTNTNAQPDTNPTDWDVLAQQGTAGVVGSRWYVDFGAPSNTLGNDTDDYLNLATGDIYQKVSGVWVLSGNIKGASGEDAVASGTSLLGGGTVAWVSGFTYRVGAAEYYINGTRYTSTEQNVTLDAADASLDRIDVIAFNSSGPVKITGTPAASPVEPTLDPTVYLRRTIIYVPAASAAANVVITSIYAEGVEWTATASGAGITLNSTTGPRSGTKLIDGTNVAAGGYVDFVTAAFDVTSKNAVVLYVDPKAAWPTKKAIRLTWFNGSTQKGSTVTIGNGTFGFNSQVGGAYQQLAVPISLFGLPAGTNITKLRAEIVGAGANVGFKWDDFQLQAGVSALDFSDVLHFRGTWSSTTSYNKNDVVYYGGSSYVALLPSANQNPSTAGTYWIVFAAKGTDGAGAALTNFYSAYAHATADDAHTANNTIEDINSMSVTLSPGGAGKLLCWYTGVVAPVSGDWEHVFVRFALDGATFSDWFQQSRNTAPSNSPIYRANAHHVFTGVTAGSHTVKVQTWDGSSSQNLTWKTRSLTVLSDVTGIGPAALPRGLWAIGGSYAINDWVSWNGSSYVAVAASVAVEPGTDSTKWMQTAAKGDPYTGKIGFSAEWGDGSSILPISGQRRAGFAMGAGSFVSFRIWADVACTCSIDILKNGVSIFSGGATKPTLTAATGPSTFGDMTGVTTAFAEGDRFEGVLTLTSGNPFKIVVAAFATPS